MTWLFILWNLAFLVLLVVAAYRAGFIGGTTQATIDSISHSRLWVGLTLAWLVGFVVISLMWFRGRSRT